MDSNDQTLALITQALTGECSRAPDGSDGWTYGSCGMGIPLTSIIVVDAIFRGGVSPCPIQIGALQLVCNTSLPTPCIYDCPDGGDAGMLGSPTLNRRRG